MAPSQGITPKSGLGECIEDYEVSNLLGKGGFATVYKGRCRRTLIDVAIKMIDKKLISANKMEKRVREEVTIHSQLKHPSVLELYTFFEDKNYVYLVLELAHNGELQRYMKTNQTTFTEEEAANILKQVVDGLKYLHSHYILHRDMTLSNLLLSKDMRVKIGDFGLATKLSRPDETHQTMCGTPNYISPEVVLRSSHGLEVDVWGLGCMLYTLLVGRPPFDTKAIRSTLTRVINSDYQIPHHISSEAKDLIHRLLKKNPTERMKLEDILHHSFMRRSSVTAQCKNQSGHEVESGIGTMTTGSKQETMADSAALGRARCRSADRNEGSRGLGGLRQKFHHLMPPEALSPRSPHFLPSRQTHAYYCQGEADMSSHSRRDRSSHESVRSGCSRHSNNSHRCDSVKSAAHNDRCESAKNCRPLGVASYPNRFETEPNGHLDDPSGSVKCGSVKNDLLPTTWNEKCGSQNERFHENDCCSSVKNSGCDPNRYCDGGISSRSLNSPSKLSNNPCGSNQPTARCEGGPLCRTCGLKSEGLYSQCMECKQIQQGLFQMYNIQLPSSRTRNVCDCSRQSKCGCDDQGCDKNAEIEENEEDILDSVMSSERRFLPTVEKPIKPRRDRETPTKKLLNPTPSSNLNPAEIAVNKVVTPEIDGNEKRNLDNVAINVPPLCSDRLKPARHVTNKSVLSILETGEVCFELLKKGGNSKKDKVIEVCRISSDGLRVLIYSPHSRGVPLSERPPPVPDAGADYIFSYQSLPSKHHKKYVHAARFISLVRAQTPKVTYYTDLARCVLMENSPNNDFEATFYAGGKISKLEANSNVIKMIDPEGKAIDINERDVDYLSMPKKKMFQHFKQALEHCLSIERALETVSTTETQCFPAVIGSKPSTSEAFKGKENTTMTPNGPTLGSYEVSGVSSAKRPGSSQSRSSARSRTVDIPHIGVATQKPNGELKIMYRDGTELSYDASAGITYHDGRKVHKFRHSETEWLPEAVRAKLGQLPTVLRNFLPPESNSRHRPRPLR